MLHSHKETSDFQNEAAMIGTSATNVSCVLGDLVLIFIVVEDGEHHSDLK